MYCDYVLSYLYTRYLYQCNNKNINNVVSNYINMTVVYLGKKNNTIGNSLIVFVDLPMNEFGITAKKRAGF